MKKLFLLSLLTLTLTGCARMGAFDNPMVSDAKVTDITRSGEILRDLPAPMQRVPVSVYEFQDQTGQFKANDKITDYSSAVTKGGLSVLTKALLDSGARKWFMVAERGGLKNLMQERAIVRAMRQDYADAHGQQLQNLPPLIYGGVLLEGGIVFYDSNVMTGGVGARYFGIGGSTEYRRDIVTVYLRATSVQNGEVLLSVTSSKTIFSYGLSASVSRYFSIDKLLEAEAGFTVNEPSQLAVRQAIETSVYSMIMEGALNGLWKFQDETAGKFAIAEYLKRRDSTKSEADIMRSMMHDQDASAPEKPVTELKKKAELEEGGKTSGRPEQTAEPLPASTAPVATSAPQEAPAAESKSLPVASTGTLSAPAPSASSNNTKNNEEVLDTETKQAYTPPEVVRNYTSATSAPLSGGYGASLPGSRYAHRRDAASHNPANNVNIPID